MLSFTNVCYHFLPNSIYRAHTVTDKKSSHVIFLYRNAPIRLPGDSLFCWLQPMAPRITDTRHRADFLHIRPVSSITLECIYENFPSYIWILLKSRYVSRKLEMWKNIWNSHCYYWVGGGVGGVGEVTQLSRYYESVRLSTRPNMYARNRTHDTCLRILLGCALFKATLNTLTHVNTFDT